MIDGPTHVEDDYNSIAPHSMYSGYQPILLTEPPRAFLISKLLREPFKPPRLWLRKATVPFPGALGGLVRHQGPCNLREALNHPNTSASWHKEMKVQII